MFSKKDLKILNILIENDLIGLKATPEELENFGISCQDLEEIGLL